MAAKLFYITGLFLLTILFLETVHCQVSNDTNVLLSTELLNRRNFIKNMTKTAWTAYKMDAWGKNGLDPFANNSKAHRNEPNTGKTILSSLSTLWLMNLTEESKQARDWVKEGLNGSLMHVNDIGPLLSAYALTNDSLFLDRARELADNLFTKYNQTVFGIETINSQMTTVEFQYLSQITGNKAKYLDPIERNLQEIFNTSKYVTRFFGHKRMLVELLKFIQANSSNWNSLNYFNRTLSSLNSTGRLLQSKWSSYPLYISYDSVDPKSMSQSDCSFGAIFALAYKTFTGRYQSKPEPMEILRLAKEITATCSSGALTTNAYKLPPQYMKFDVDDTEDNPKNATITIDGGYDLTHYLAETYFTMYRVTREEKYRHYAWELAQAIEKHCRVPGGGYAGLQRLDGPGKEWITFQPPEFLGATLKFLYLIFEEPEVLSLDKWVFTLDGQPIPIKGS